MLVSTAKGFHLNTGRLNLNFNWLFRIYTAACVFLFVAKIYLRPYVTKIWVSAPAPSKNPTVNGGKSYLGAIFAYCP